MLISDVIAQMIEDMLKSSGGSLDIKRNELAQKVGCAPSQINYVITSRFTPERGYIIESRRGGGGYVRIIKKEMGRDAYLMHCVYALGQEIDERSAVAFLVNLADRGFIDESVLRSACATVSNAAIGRVAQPYRNTVRADIIRQFILSLMK
ncbi:MAG: CtsR family transcriptional regulator [Ruminococcaceae bacterium]|nr:CtsR family transcriptional regulator [Oscillospiraceae bacterium]